MLPTPFFQFKGQNKKHFGYVKRKIDFHAILKTDENAFYYVLFTNKELEGGGGGDLTNIDEINERA